MKTLITLLFFAFAILVQVTTPQSHKKDGGRIALDKVSLLPEVKVFLRQYKNRKAIAVLDGLLDKDSKYYRVKVGISDMGMLRTNFNFYINPKTDEIFYADYYTEQGEQTNLITVAQVQKTTRLAKMALL
jgi:hypothetical protein